MSGGGGVERQDAVQAGSKKRVVAKLKGQV